MLKKLFAGFVTTICGLSLIGMTSAQWGVGQQNSFTDSTVWGNTQNVNVIGAGTGQQDSFGNVVRWFINWVLGIMALIALVILLRWGFQMVTAAGNEDKYKAGFTILKQAALGLALIGVAWFIISLIFFVIEIAGRWGENSGGNTLSQ